MASSITAIACVVAALIAAASAASVEGLHRYKCEKEGRFPDPEDCTSYYICRMNSVTGEFKVSNGTCKGGFPFHPQKHFCVDPQEVPGCKSRNPRHKEWEETAVEFPDFECEQDGFYCYDCETTLMCIDGVAYLEENCESGYTCQEAGSFASYTCYDSVLGEGPCTCAEGKTFIADPYNDQGFSYCSTPDTAPVFSQCEGDMVFNLTIEACVNANGAPECTKAGKYANPNDCNEFYNCLPIAGGRYKQVFQYCEEGLMYNEKIDDCTDPCRWKSPFFECTKEGRFRDPQDCGKYYICTEYKDELGTFNQRNVQCPPLTLFKQESDGFGICSPEAECEEATDTQCAIPDICPDELESPSLPGGNESATAATSVTDSGSLISGIIDGDQSTTSTDSEGESPVPSLPGEGESPTFRLGFRRKKPSPADIVASISPNLLLNN